MLAKSVNHPKVLCNPAFRPRDDEHPIGAQLLGTDPDVMAIAAKGLVQIGYDLIDLNFACPAPKVLRRKQGGYLLNDPERVMEIYRRVRKAVTCPVLMKLRTGFDNSPASRNNFWKIASQASSDGVDALVVHGRSVLQKYKTSADWQILAELKRQFPDTTIIGSGDLFDAQTAADRLRTTGIDGAVIGRGAIGNPWIFQNLRAIVNGETASSPPHLNSQGQVITKHFELVWELYEKAKAVRYFRKFAVNYCRHHPQRKKAQQSLLAAESKNEVFDAIKKWYEIN